MQISFENNPKDFLKKYGSYLSKNEAEHNLIYSLCQSAQRKKDKGEKTDVKFSVLSDGGDFVIAGAQLPGHNLVLSKSEQLEIGALAEAMAKEKQNFPGIIGPSDVASSFANKWAALTGQRFNEYMDQIIYAIKNVLMPPAVNGKMRFANADEKELVAEWIRAFAASALPKSEHLTHDAAIKEAEKRLATKSIAVWDVDGRAVTQAGVSGTDTVGRISLVYTPPDERGHGYASALMAHLTQHLLNEGRKLCCLYADARNPVSNSIYRKIGYEFVGRSSLYVLEKPI